MSLTSYIVFLYISLSFTIVHATRLLALHIYRVLQVNWTAGKDEMVSNIHLCVSVAGTPHWKGRRPAKQSLLTCKSYMHTHKYTHLHAHTATETTWLTTDMSRSVEWVEIVWGLLCWRVSEGVYVERTATVFQNASTVRYTSGHCWSDQLVGQ